MKGSTTRERDRDMFVCAWRAFSSRGDMLVRVTLAGHAEIVFYIYKSVCATCAAASVVCCNMNEKSTNGGDACTSLVPFERCFALYAIYLSYVMFLSVERKAVVLRRSTREHEKKKSSWPFRTHLSAALPPLIEHQSTNNKPLCACAGGRLALHDTKTQQTQQKNEGPFLQHWFRLPP